MPHEASSCPIRDLSTAVTSVPDEETGAYWTGRVIIVLLPANRTSGGEIRLATDIRGNYICMHNEATHVNRAVGQV